MLDRRKLIACAGAAILPPFASRVALAQGSDAWPSRIVKLVVPFTPGGGIDAVGRIIGARLS
jgi:tripartite-type tricarboxylate transporter receptor subunit TctC